MLPIPTGFPWDLWDPREFPYHAHLYSTAVEYMRRSLYFHTISCHCLSDETVKRSERNTSETLSVLMQGRNKTFRRALLQSLTTDNLTEPFSVARRLAQFCIILDV